MCLFVLEMKIGKIVMLTKMTSNFNNELAVRRPTLLAGFQLPDIREHSKHPLGNSRSALASTMERCALR